MSDLATLLPGIAAIITSISGGVIGVLAVRGGSKRERKRAAEGAIDRVLGADDEGDDDDRSEALTEILEELLRKQKEGGDG